MKKIVSEQTAQSIQDFAQEIAHQIRNPLGSIELFASLLLKDHQGERDRTRISQIINAVRIIERRLSEFMMSSKIHSIPLEVIHINGFIRETVGFAEHVSDGDNLFLSVQYGSTDYFIRGNRDMLKHLFISLIFNAVKNLPEEWHIRLEIVSDELDSYPEKALRRDEFIHVTLTAVERRVQRSRPFRSPLEVFFPSIKENTSLGLSVLHSILMFHGGFFSLKDEGSGGMSIQISMPRYSTV